MDSPFENPPEVDLLPQKRARGAEVAPLVRVDAAAGGPAEAEAASDLPNVAIEPKELLFQGPNHREPIARHLALTNPHNRDVCFKVKTTAPKRYYVRPNAARLRANTSDTVEGAPSALPLSPAAGLTGEAPARSRAAAAGERPGGGRPER